MRDYRFVGCAILFFILTAGTAMADLFGKSSLTPDWVARFQDLSKLNAYTARQPVHLSNVAITGWDISGAKFPGARFDNTEWKDVKLERSVLTNVTVSKSKLQGVSFDRSELTDVTFEDTELRSTSFYKARLQRVRFVRCKFNGVTIDEMVGGTIDITDSKLLSSSLSDGQLIATIKGSTLKDVRLSDLQPPSSLTFANSELKDVDFSRSVLETLVLNHVNAAKGGFTGGQVKSIEIRDSQFGLDFVEMQIDTFRIERSKIQSALNSSRIADLTMTDCKNMKDMTLYKVNVGRMEVQQCDLNDFALVKANVDQLRVQKARLTKNEYTASRIKSLMLENVSLGGQMDFTDAHVDHLVTANVTKAPGLSLITTGSNVKFE